MKKTLVVGASENPTRYSNKATHRLLFHGHPVELLGLREGHIASTRAAPNSRASTR